MKKEFQKIIAEKDTYDEDSRNFIESLQFADKEISQINSMKATAGWKVMDSKIRTELKQRITDLVKDDLKIQTLLALLQVADTKSASQLLESEIARILPE